MPMYDTTSLIQAGIPQSKKMLKYGNAIDQDGKTITPNLLKYNLSYGDLFLSLIHISEPTRH